MTAKASFIISMALLFSVPAFADLSVGYLTITSDSPTGGEQQLAIINMTGPANCQLTEYTACTPLNFTNWTLTIDYTSSYYNGTGPTEPSPLVFTDSGSGLFGGYDIVPSGSMPSSTNNLFPIDLCGGAGACSDPNIPITTITSVEFSGQISSSSICLYDPAVSGCNVANPTTFAANRNFDLKWNSSSTSSAASPSATGSPYVDEGSTPIAQSPDITVTQASAATPEPSFYLLLTFLLTALLFFARFGRRSKSDSQI
jgi:hypothetical protein